MTLLTKLLAAITCFLLLPGYVSAHGGGGSPFSGTIVCGGYYTLDNSQRYRIVMMNINEKADIKITRIRVYFKDGALGGDTDILGYIPAGRNNILGPTNDILGPHQTERYLSEDVYGTEPDQVPPLQQGNVQTVIEWSSNSLAKPPVVSLVRHIHNLSITGTPLARSSSTCESLR